MTVEHLPDGEVSTFLTDQLRPGDELDVRGPIGGWFVWPATSRHCSSMGVPVSYH
jgi:ferredoxin-NADP reductase